MPDRPIPAPDLRIPLAGRYHAHLLKGAIAQLGERLHGMQEVAGSIPASSTNPAIELIRIASVPIV